MIEHISNNRVKLTDSSSTSKSNSVQADYDPASVSSRWMGKYKSARDGKMHKVYFYLSTSDFAEAEEYFEDIIPEPFSYANLLGSAPSEDLLEADGFTQIDCAASSNATHRTDKRLSPTSAVAWNDLEFSEQLKLMKDYVTRYNGTKIFEDFADYVGQDVFDIVDCFSDAEYRGDIRVPQSKQSESEFANDDIYSSSDIVTL